MLPARPGNWLPSHITHPIFRFGDPFCCCQHLRTFLLATHNCCGNKVVFPLVPLAEKRTRVEGHGHGHGFGCGIDVVVGQPGGSARDPTT